MIYIHIPFCKQACHYCDFHFSTSLRNKEEMLQGMMDEIVLRKDYLTDKNLSSIYFGGGTPSILDVADINKILDRIAQHFDIDADAEITLEANPDDLTKSKVEALRTTEINRFSIGIQSFYEEDLRWMNRAHNANEADTAIKRVQDAGFENITCDLIYGYPLLTDQKWQSNIDKLLSYDVQHISSYSMTVEEKTALHHFVRNGKTKPMDDEQSIAQMEYLIEILTRHQFEHYEISNFAKNGQYAKHNTNYWRGRHYLGIGPSAHSFNGSSRSWNIANNAIYARGILNREPNLEIEELSFEDQVNEYIMTSLRTMWGIDLTTLKNNFGSEIAAETLKNAEIFIQSGDLLLHENTITLSLKGKKLADHIASELFFIANEVR